MVARPSDLELAHLTTKLSHGGGDNQFPCLEINGINVGVRGFIAGKNKDRRLAGIGRRSLGVEKAGLVS